MGLAGERLEDLRLIVSELAANSLDYGGGSGVLRLWPEDPRVVFDISDAGHIADPLAGRRPVGPRHPGLPRPPRDQPPQRSRPRPHLSRRHHRPRLLQHPLIFFLA
ncbi:hypothetical protein SAMN05216276_1010109 [Streptosporangium subroseum]|uniref:Anti-sigma regulatory factor (Ser/Thr protein kinase) n=1 Tax=Streptosporangium subroseum TaxID=106412 RepID=A0A239EX62_9ACTN|nr:hypothetical protein [Streptosporangium subroseum]SNS49167.1 hypothetical protein SAMN05216276_1010109 [Streptosporangium subroseum]